MSHSTSFWIALRLRLTRLSQIEANKMADQGAQREKI